MKTSSEVQMRTVQLQMQSDRLNASARSPVQYEVQPLINQRYADVLVRELKKAQDSIWVAMFLIERSEYGGEGFGPAWILGHVEDALDRGVAVQFLLGKEGKRTPQGALGHQKIVEEMSHPNFQGYVYPHSRKLHAKMVLIDKKTALVGAHNWTWHSLNRSHETSFLLRGDREINRLSDRFQKLWTETGNYYEEQEEADDV